MEVWQKNAERVGEIWAKIHRALNDGNDAEYARTITEKLHFTAYREQTGKIGVIDQILKSLEPQVLSTTERSFDEWRARLGKPRKR